jgi:arsenate reductase-like glutaredoxin family protein
MKPIYIVLAILTASAIIGMVTIGSQQIYALRTCGQCSEFKKLTTEFEKNVIDAASINPPDGDRIQTLLEQYNRDVLELFPSTSPS